MLQVVQERCTGCSLCIPACPVEALKVVTGKVQVNRNLCNNCLECIPHCPVEALEDR